jgi:hypothetical protein
MLTAQSDVPHRHLRVSTEEYHRTPQSALGHKICIGEPLQKKQDHAWFQAYAAM